MIWVDSSLSDRDYSMGRHGGKGRGRNRAIGSLRVLLGNQSLASLVLAFGAVTVAEWMYVTVLSIDAFRSDGAIAVSLVGWLTTLRGRGAALHSVPRSAHVVASAPTVTLSLHRDDFVPAVRSRLMLG